MKSRPMISITNCRKNSYAWFHEQRHKQQEESWQLLSKWMVFDEAFKTLAVLTCVFQQWFLATVFVVALWAFDFTLELDAELSALHETRNWRAFLRLTDVNA